jgi:hypothetical protein
MASSGLGTDEAVPLLIGHPNVIMDNEISSPAQARQRITYVQPVEDRSFGFSC